MKRGLNRTELLGIIMLAILIAGITLVALLVKDCSGNNPESPDYPPQIEVVDPSAPSRDFNDYTPRKKSSGRSSHKKTGGRKKSAAGSSSSRSNSAREEQSRMDPFSDTIPLDWDEFEEGY